jgi:hypothetical protein
MLRTEELCVGWMDSSVHHFLESIDPPPANMKYALITCLDSSFDVASMLATSAALQPLKRQAEVVGPSVLVSTRRLLSAERKEQIFHGFDEVWFFPSAEVKPKPKQVSLVGPSRLPQELPKALVRWMEEHGCSLGLGDGAGLNFVARLQGVAKFLVSEWAESLNGVGSRN